MMECLRLLCSPLQPELIHSDIEQRLSPLAFAPHLDALKQSTADRVRAALRQILSGRSDTVDAVDQTAQAVVEGLARGRDYVPCDWDPSIPASAAGITDLTDAGALIHLLVKQHACRGVLVIYHLTAGCWRGAGPFFIAANLYNNADLMPHFITQLLHLIIVLPPHTVYLSVYESNSVDDTGTAHLSVQSHAQPCCARPAGWFHTVLCFPVQVPGWKSSGSW